MNILCSTDTNYVPFCGVMLTSLFENNKEKDIIVYVLTNDLSKSAEGKLNELATYYSQQIRIVRVDESAFNNCPIDALNDHVSIATYFRLATADLLPRNIDRILYLDCDIIVAGALGEFYGSDFDGKACVVVRDEASELDMPYERLNIIKDDKPYFNAGVILMDLDYWRFNSLSIKFMEYITQHKEHLAFHDQDTLNVVLRNQVKFDHTKFNLQRGFVVKSVFDQEIEQHKKEILEAMESPVIIHYTGKGKPWMVHDRNPLNRIWISYFKKSLWRSMPLIEGRTPLLMKLKQLVNNVIWSLGIKKRFQTYIINTN